MNSLYPLDNVEPGIRSSSAGSYANTNEDFTIWRNYVKELRIERAAGISSSGEIGMFAILPSVRKELTLIDLAWGSLSAAFFRYALVKQFGAKRASEILIGREAYPEGLATQIMDSIPDTRKDDVRYYLRNCINNHTNRKVDPRLIKKAQTKLSMVKFVHADIRNVVLPHQVDLLYMSNAFEYFNGFPNGLKPIDDMVKPGGHILCAHGYSGDIVCRELERIWMKIDSKKSNSNSWAHILWRKK